MNSENAVLLLREERHLHGAKVPGGEFRLAPK